MLTKKKFKIDGMHCTSCAMLIDGELEDLDGVKKAATNYAQQECEVEFDDDKTTEEEMIVAVKKVGYSIIKDTT